MHVEQVSYSESEESESSIGESYHNVFESYNLQIWESVRYCWGKQNCQTHVPNDLTLITSERSFPGKDLSYEILLPTIRFVMLELCCIPS